MFKYIDLFAGAGGLSEGFLREGYIPIVHVEKDKFASMTIKTRMAYYYLKENNNMELYFDYLKGRLTQNEFYKNIPEEVLNSVINEEISDKTIESIFSKIDKLKSSKQIDLIIGGPPCQAYSLIGRPRNNKNPDDIRLFLYKQYFKFIKKYQPKIIVFENVPGMYSAGNGEIFENIKKEFINHGYIFDFRLLNSSNFGVLQERKRVIIIGWKDGMNFSYPEFIKNKHNYTINDLFSDIPSIKHGECIVTGKYSKEEIPEYLSKFKIRNKEDILTQHITRKHNENDLEIYKLAIEMWDSEKRRLKYTDIPANLQSHKNTTSFLDRFKVVNKYGLSHTMVAHISKDGHNYIHPDNNQLRSISIREAARIQSFPDDYYFEGPRTSIFTQIGNAVPPIMAEVIANKIKERMIEVGE